MTHNNNFIPGLRKFFCKKSFLDDKRIAKDDNALAYGEKDPFKTSRFKKKIQRNLSHRGNLSELESNKEYKDNNVSKDLNINDLKDINHIKNFNILKGTIPNDIDRKEFNQKKGTNKNINVKDSKPLKDLTSNDKEDLIDFKDPKDLIELNGLKNLKDLKDFKNLHSTDYKTLKDPRHLLFPLTQKTIIEEKEENEISSSDDGLNINEEDKEELESSNSDENFSWDRIKQQKPELKPLKKNTSEQKNGEIEKKEELRKKKLVKVISMPELNGVVDKIEKIERNGVEKQYDEIFFYYFESYLDQFLVKKLNRKRLSSHG